MDWRDAMGQGKEKAIRQGLNYYIVTNCRSDFRYYNVYNDEEIILDGKVLTKLVPLEILQKIQSQVTKGNNYVIHKSSKSLVPISETKFRNTLKKLADIYRSAGLKKGDERIDPTVSFVVLKYTSEKEAERRTLPTTIELWDDLKKVAESEYKDLRAKFKQMEDQIWGEDSEYKDNIYKDFKNLITLRSKLKMNIIKRYI